jgi:hypothetical protein
MKSPIVACAIVLTLALGALNAVYADLGAVYLCLVGGDTGESDLVVANSVSIDPTATLTLSENGTAPVGMTFTIIESTGNMPIIGSFMNLPDGGTITARIITLSKPTTKAATGTTSR